MFQQRHFEAIAQMMQELSPQGDKEGDYMRASYDKWNQTRNALVSLFQRHNSRFDVARFERACKPGANVRARKAA